MCQLCLQKVFFCNDTVNEEISQEMGDIKIGGFFSCVDMMKWMQRQFTT